MDRSRLILFALLWAAPLAAEDAVARAAALVNQGRYRDAAGAYEALIAQDPGNASLHQSLGLCYQSLGEYERAATALGAAVSASTDPSGPAYSLALLQEALAQGPARRQRLAKARDAWRLVVSRGRGEAARTAARHMEKIDEELGGRPVSRLVRLAAALLTGCVHSTALNVNYDLAKVKRIGVARFEVPAGAPDGTEDLFAKHLLGHGYAVIERSRLDAVMKELNLGLSGTLSSDSAKKIGRVLGVDALLLGEVTGFTPRRTSIVLAENRTRVEEPVFQTFQEKRPDGSIAQVPRQVGVNVRHEKTQTPQTFVIDAQVGVVAKLVDVETGELIWAGSDSEEAVNPLMALDGAAATLAGKMKKQWDQAAKQRRSAPPIHK